MYTFVQFKVSVYGHTAGRSYPTYTHVLQCSPANVGLTQARPNRYCLMYCVTCSFSCFIALLGILNCYSVKLTAKVMSVLTALKLLACGFVIVLGLYHLIRTGCFPKDSQQPFANSVVVTSSFIDASVKIALALYGVMWACDAW